MKEEIQFELKRRRINSDNIKISSKASNLFDPKITLNDDVMTVNSKHLLSIPFNGKDIMQEKRPYAQCLLNQDWSFLFESYEDQSSKFYVYAHVDPRETGFGLKEFNLQAGKGIPFYIGKGTGDRAYDLKRNQGHGKILKILKDGLYEDDRIVKILFENLSERKAMEIESKLIYFFGTKYENGRKGILFNLDISKRPEFIGGMRHYVTKKIKRIESENKKESE